MSQFRPFEPDDVLHLQLQGAQALHQGALARPGFGAQLVGPHAWTMEVDGRPVACAGVKELWPGRGLAWALIEPWNTAAWIAGSLKVRQVLDQAQAEGMWRIEIAVLAGWKRGERWAEWLGFTCETPDTPMRGYTPDGADYRLWARIDEEALANAVRRASATLDTEAA